MKRWFQPSPRSELKPIPWLAPQVIEYLNSLIQPNWEIIEHGSGGSTLWFAERAAKVWAIENDPDWYSIVRDTAKKHNHVQVFNLRTVKFETPSAVRFDLCLIDGEPVEDRADWLRAAPELVHPGGWVVLDNANRPEYAKERKHLQAYAAEVVTFDANEGGTLYLVTEFYKLPPADGDWLPESVKGELADDVIQRSVEAKPKPKRKKKGGK